jgi:hypothetical protein
MIVSIIFILLTSFFSEIPMLETGFLLENSQD